MTHHLAAGEYFGQHNHKVSFSGITITDTEYTHDYVDWHYHENPYFTFILQGQLQEENKKNAYTLSRGTLLFHHWQDYHRNFKPPGLTRGAHIEINKEWFKGLDVELIKTEDSLQIDSPIIKNLIYKIILESKIKSADHETSIQFLLIELLSVLHHNQQIKSKKKPEWLKDLMDIIWENQDTSLENLSTELGLHPVYISRTFHQHCDITFGQYCREIRLNKALNSILSKQNKLTTVAHNALYYDQSHMVRDFKNKLKMSPKQVASLLG